MTSKRNPSLAVWLYCYIAGEYVRREAKLSTLPVFPHLFMVRLDDPVSLIHPDLVMMGTELFKLKVISILVGGQEWLTESAREEGVPAAVFSPMQPVKVPLPSVAGHQSVVIIFRKVSDEPSKQPRLF